MKKIPISVQRFREIIEENHLYIDKTEYIFNLIDDWKYYFCSRPRRWGKSLTLDTMKEVFLWNKELFKGLKIYDLYKDWDKSYPVVVFSFMTYDNNYYPNLVDFLEETTRIYIDNKDYKISDFVEKWIDKIKYLVKAIYEKTWKQVVLLFDEYDTPFTKNLNNSTEYQKLKDFFFNFYIDAKELSEYIKFFYLSGFTKVLQTDLFSAMNHLRDITYSSKYNAFIGYTLEEIKKYFHDFIPNTCKELNTDEISLFKKIAIWYDWYYFGDNDNRLYNPRTINNFFQKSYFSGYWQATWTASIVENVFSNPSSINISDFLLKLVNNTLRIRKEALSIDSIKDITPELLLLQSWYLTFSDEWCSTLKIPNMEIRNALYSDFKQYIRNRKELINYFNASEWC